MVNETGKFPFININYPTRIIHSLFTKCNTAPTTFHSVSISSAENPNVLHADTVARYWDLSSINVPTPPYFV